MWGRQGRSGVGRDGPSRGWASVVLKERQEVIVTIARQVRRVQVREELVRVCEFWKELQRKYRSPDEVSAEGLGEEPRAPPSLFACLPPASPGPSSHRETNSAGVPRCMLVPRCMVSPVLV